MFAVMGFVAVLFAAVFTAASSWTTNTPLYTMRMEQQSSKMSFLPTEVNGFTYTTGNGYTLNTCAAGYCGVVPLGTDATCHPTCMGNTCETCTPTCPWTCWNTCDDPTCPSTCPVTCETCETCTGETCNEPTCPTTCWWTCSFSTCPYSSCAYSTCAYSTCYKSTCMYGGTCDITC